MPVFEVIFDFFEATKKKLKNVAILTSFFAFFWATKKKANLAIFVNKSR